MGEEAAVGVVISGVWWIVKGGAKEVSTIGLWCLSTGRFLKCRSDRRRADRVLHRRASQFQPLGCSDS